MNLTLNCYTQWYWKINLHNLLHFLKLRADSHAQYEIRVYAEIILDIVKKWVPHSYNAFVNYQQNAKSFSQNALTVLQKLLHQQPVSQENGKNWLIFLNLTYKFMSIGTGELILILVIILVLFGAGKLPQVMQDIGKGIKNLKKGLNENEENNKKE